MKQIRIRLAATILMLALTGTAFAGNMDTTVASPQPPPAITSTGDMQTTVAGQMETGITANEATDADSLREIALSLFQNVLSLF